MRSKAKRLAYGLLYGMGIDRLAQQLGCGSEAARGQAEGFKRCLAGVEDWKKRVAASAERQGFVQTIGGRKRFFGELRGRRGRLTDDQRAACTRQDVNTTCQGNASDIIKRAMVNIQGEIDRSPRLGGGRSRHTHKYFLQQAQRYLESFLQSYLGSLENLRSLLGSLESDLGSLGS